MLCVALVGEPASAARVEQTEAVLRTSGRDGGRFIRTVGKKKHFIAATWKSESLQDPEFTVINSKKSL